MGKAPPQTSEETRAAILQLPLFAEREIAMPVKPAVTGALYGRILDKDTDWIVDAKPDVMERVRRLFAYARSSETPGQYTHSAAFVRKTLEVARDLVWLMDRYRFEIDPEIEVEMRLKAARYDSIATIMDGVGNDVLFDISGTALEMGEPARPHQIAFRNIFLQIERMLLGDDVGLGKTISAIMTLVEPHMRPALIVVPTSLPLQWIKQINRFLPGASTHIVIGLKAYELPKVDVLVTTYSRLFAWQDRFAKYGIKTLIFDEIQDLRHSDSQKRTAAATLSRRVDYCLGLSATPIYNQGQEIWSVLDVISPDTLGPEDRFKAEWCVSGGPVRNTLALNSFLKDRGLMLRRTKADLGIVSDPVTKEIITLDGDLHSLAAVKDIAKHLALSVLTGAVGVSSKAAAELDWKLRQATGVAKARAAAQFIRMIVESKGPVFVSAWHREVYTILLRELKNLNPVMCTGSESGAQKAKSVKEFMEGRSRVFICSNRSGAGIDGLQTVCSDAIIVELDWSPQVTDQLIGRLDREGQQNPVTAYFLLIDDGSDPFLLEVLGEKQSQHEGIVEGKANVVDILESGVDRGDRIRKMAEGYLASIGESIPKKEVEVGLHADVVRALRRLRVPVNSEREMQEGLWSVLPGMLPDAIVEREVKISARSRLDFMVSNNTERVAIECKINQTGKANVYGQVRRYAEEASATSIVLFAPWGGVQNFTVEKTPVTVVDWSKAKL